MVLKLGLRSWLQSAIRQPTPLSKQPGMRAETLIDPIVEFELVSEEEKLAATVAKADIAAPAERAASTAAELKLLNESIGSLKHELAMKSQSLEILEADLMSARQVATALEGKLSDLKKEADRPWIRIERGKRIGAIDPVWFATFPFEDGDRLTVVPESVAASLPIVGSDVNVPVTDGEAIRVPPVWTVATFQGFSLPHHLVSLTGAGPETLEAIGKHHLNNYRRFVGIEAGMTVVDFGCGIGRDAFQFFEALGSSGKYIGIDVTRDAIVWCQNNITTKYPNFIFHHFDAFSEVYNPLGAKTSIDMRLPIEDATVDRIVLASVFTHLLEDEVLHYLREFRRVLKPDGLVYASFFLYSQEAIEAARTKGTTSWVATFSHELSNGVFGNHPQYPRGAVAYSDEKMRSLIDKSGMRLMRPYLKGWWSGLHEDPIDGQDAVILGVSETSSAQGRSVS
jgi:ubiquinone/menaquinone biosynthesis C-methylase UbiE